MKTKAKPVKKIIPDCSLVNHNLILSKKLLTCREIKTINAYLHFLDLERVCYTLNTTPNCCLTLIGSALLKLEYIHSL